MNRRITSTLRHLRVFQTVAKTRNIRRAADTVRLTQPAVTLAIARLEMQAETVLFDRRSRGTFLTREGEILAARVNRLFDQIEGALAEFCTEHPSGITPAGLADRFSRAHVKAIIALSSPEADDESEGTSRASLFRSVREVERMLGLELIATSAEGLALNPLGVELARRISVAMTELDAAMDEIASVGQQQPTQIRLGALPMSGSFVLAMVLNRLANVQPEVQTELRTGDLPSLRPALLRGEIDFIVGLVDLERRDERLVQEAITPLKYVVVARQGHPLAQKGFVDVKDLSEFDWVAPNANTARRATFEALLDRMDRKPAHNIHASSLSTLRLLLTGSNRLALLTSFEYEVERSAGELVVLPAGPIEPGHALGVTARANWEPSALQRGFLDLVRAEAERIAARVDLGQGWQGQDVAGPAWQILPN